MFIETIASIALATSALNPTVVPQATPAQSEPSEPHRLEDLVVTGRHRDEIIRDFVENVADPVAGRPLARWRSEVCVSVINMESQSAHFIVERISHVAREVGLRSGGPRCKPNLVLVASANPAGEAQGLVQRYRRLLKPNMTGASQGRAELARFQESDAPIRWWHINQVTDQNGRRAFRAPGDTPFDKSSLHEAAYVSVMPSRLWSSYSEDINYAVAIFNPRELEHLTALQLADYLSLVTLAQISPTASTANYDSILNVTDANYVTEADQLTQWDWAYLKGLYSATRTQSNLSASRVEIASSISRAADRLNLSRDPEVNP